MPVLKEPKVIKSDFQDKMLIRFVNPVPKFVGSNGFTYGPFDEENIDQIMPPVPLSPDADMSNVMDEVEEFRDLSDPYRKPIREALDELNTHLSNTGKQVLDYFERDRLILYLSAYGETLRDNVIKGLRNVEPMEIKRALELQKASNIRYADYILLKAADDVSPQSVLVKRSETKESEKSIIEIDKAIGAAGDNL